MTKHECQIVRNDSLRALQAIALACGLEVEIAGGTYDDAGCTLKVAFLHTTRNGMPREQADFVERAFLYGLTPEAYGKTVMIQGEAFIAIGFAMKRGKFPLKVKRQRDGVLKFATYQTIETLQRMGFATAAGTLTEVPL